jgi:ADP-heptose:LPS heptosyltransferase
VSRRPVVVALRALGVGDLCTAIPALRALHRHLPQPLLVAAPAVLAPLIELAEVGHHLPLDSLRASWPALAPVALAVNLHGAGPESVAMLRALAPPRLVSHRRAEDIADGRRRWRDDEHDRVRWCRLVGQQLAIPTDPEDLRIVAPSTPRRPPPRALVHVGAAAPARRWPTDRFAHVVEALVQRGLRCHLTGGADERHLGRAVIARLARSTRSQVVDLTGRTSLAQLLDEVAAADLVVCGDTGVGHLASAFGRPSVVLFGPIDPARWGPPSWGPHVALWAGRRGDPHGSVTDAGLLDIGADEVCAALDRLVGSPAGHVVRGGTPP